MYADSQVDGDLLVDNMGAALIIDGEVTITGFGGQIIGGEEWICSNGAKPILRNSDSQGVLTLECDPGGDGSEDECVVIRRTFDLEANLVNNAYVIADNHDVSGEWGNMILKEGYKTGNGYWIAGYDSAGGTFGRLIVGVQGDSVSVYDTETPGGTWIVRGHSSAEIRFTPYASLGTLTGPIKVYNGRLLIDQDFTTHGDLLMEDAGTQTIPRIHVTEGNVARFNVPE